MGALPKNKITRAERGKRRAGNTPSLKKEAKHGTVPLHKRGLVDQMMQALGLSKTATAQTRSQKKAANSELVEKSVSGTKATRKTAATAANSQAGKKMRRGQHK